VRERGDDVFKRFLSDKLEAMAGLRPALVKYQATLPGSRVLDGKFTAVQQAAGTPKGRPAGAKYLREFIEDVKAAGLVAKLIEKNNVRGLTVAPKA
jgi:polar amino acid transport system substrate-binding protein